MGDGKNPGLLLLSSIFLGLLCWIWGTKIIQNHYTATYGLLCYDACDMHDNEYYWCHTNNGWDYCSLLENTDYKGNECKPDHPCAKYDKDYYWCNTITGTPGHCGRVETRLMLYKSSIYQSVCRDECSFDASHLYYWCHTDKGWDYCSPSPDVTYKNERCQSNQSCDTHGYDYTWCKTDSGWGYCSLLKPTELIFRRQKRQPPELFCTKADKDNKKQTNFYAEPDDKAITDGMHFSNEIENIISRWNNGYLCNQSRSNLITTDNLRIDLQGRVKRNNQYYYNLQIQINVRRQARTSTTVAQVLIPENETIPDRYVRRAFTESFQRRARVSIEVIHGDISRIHGPNCE